MAKKKKLNVLVTGASGYIGNLLVQSMAKDREGFGTIVATDIRLPNPADREKDIVYVELDVRDDELERIFKEHKIQAVVHLAAIVTPGKKSNRELEYSVDVLGTKNVLTCSINAGVEFFITTSSGAAYGYYADNSEWLTEDDPIRGNEEFAYSHHKRLVEQMLARFREEHPELKQLIFRPGTILGANARNQITNLFDKPFVLGLRGAKSPFVIIWDQDVVGAIEMGLRERLTGIYNLAGDGALTMREMASMMGKPCIELPVPLVSGALSVLKKFNLTQYGPEQLNFLRYRPVLSNRRLKEEMGYIPKKTSRDAFEYFLANRTR